MFFEVRTKRLTVTGRNAYKTVKEQWLFEVESYTEAEARVTDFMDKQFNGEDFSITKIQPSKIERVEKTEGSDPEEHPFYKVKIELLSENDKGKIIKEPFFILVRGESPEATIVVADEVGGEEAHDHEVVKTEKTKITGVVVMEEKKPVKPKEETKTIEKASGKKKKK